MAGALVEFTAAGIGLKIAKMNKTDFLILIPTKNEIFPIAKHFQLKKISHQNFSVFEGNISEKSLFLVEAGYAKKFQNNIVQILTEFQAEKVILVGVAAALEENYRLGDGFLVGQAFLETENKSLAIVIPKSLKNFPQAVSVTGKHYVDSKQKEALKKSFPEAGLYEQENYYFTQACSARGKNFLILRMVSDDYKTKLPSSFLIFRHFEKINWKYFLRDFLKNPVDFWQLLKFKRAFHSSMKKTAVFLERLITKWDC